MSDKEKKRKPSIGTISFIETPSGQLRLAVDVYQSKHTNEEMIHIIRAVVCGMRYMYSQNEEEVLRLGEAYMDGLEVGIMTMQEKYKEKEAVKDGPKMGFHADI